MAQNHGKIKRSCATTSTGFRLEFSRIRLTWFSIKKGYWEPFSKIFSCARSISFSIWIAANCLSLATLYASRCLRSASATMPIEFSVDYFHIIADQGTNGKTLCQFTNCTQSADPVLNSVVLLRNYLIPKGIVFRGLWDGEIQVGKRSKNFREDFNFLRIERDCFFHTCSIPQKNTLWSKRVPVHESEVSRNFTIPWACHPFPHGWC